VTARVPFEGIEFGITSQFMIIWGYSFFQIIVEKCFMG
jgi:hypothetical protein